MAEMPTRNRIQKALGGKPTKKKEATWAWTEAQLQSQAHELAEAKAEKERKVEARLQTWTKAAPHNHFLRQPLAKEEGANSTCMSEIGEMFRARNEIARHHLQRSADVLAQGRAEEHARYERQAADKARSERL